jgi:starch-binding outer membrane protein, SusD/RagB family
MNTMKNKLLIYMSFTAAFSAVSMSCSESFLDHEPPGAYSEPALQNKKGMEGLLIAAYSALDGSFFESWDRNFFNQDGGGSNWIWGSIRGAEAYKGTEDTDGVELTPVERHSNPASSPYTLRKWQACYDGIFKANIVLRNVGIATGLTDEDRTRITGEARFLRGYYHFEAVKVYGVPAYVDETVPLENYKNITNEESIWPKIEEDLQFAYDNLPEVMGAVGRVNKWAAGAFLGKAYLYQAKWQDARDVLADVVASGKTATGIRYDLNKKFHSNFRITEEANNPEFVFCYEASFGDGSIANGNYENTLNNPHGSSARTGCCGFFQPSQFLVNAYKVSGAGLPLFGSFNNSDLKNDDGLEADAAYTPDLTTAVDPRLDWTVGRRGIPYLDWGKHPGKTWIRKQSYGGPYSPIKAVAYLSDFNSGLAGTVDWGFVLTAMNVKLMRYSDVLLMLAEAEAELNNPAGALPLVNRVRARAGNTEGFVASGANYSIGTYASFADADAALQAIRFERMLELAMEGHRYFDLVRWHKATEKGLTQLPFNIETYLNDYLTKEQVKRYHLSGAVFTMKYLYEPIPEEVITRSTVNGVKNVDQSTDWGGTREH